MSVWKGGGLHAGGRGRGLLMESMMYECVEGWMQAEHEQYIMLPKNYENGCDALCACVKGADGGHEYICLCEG